MRCAILLKSLIFLIFLIIRVGSVFAQEGEEGAASETGVEGGLDDDSVEIEAGPIRRSNRMEFDERLVKGQTASSGAVYLFKRVPRQLPGLVPMRRSYRRRIVEPVLGMGRLEALQEEMQETEQKGDLEGVSKGTEDSLPSTAPGKDILPQRRGGAEGRKGN